MQSCQESCDLSGGFGDAGDNGVGGGCESSEYLWLPDDIEAAMAELAPCEENRRAGVEPSPDEQQCFSNSAYSWCYTDEEPTRLGFRYREFLVDGRTGQAVVDTDDPASIFPTECVAMEDVLADPDAGQPPAPPTVEEVWAVVPIEPAVIGLSPDARGVTGMETWLWADDPGALTAGPVDIRGWTIEGSALVERSTT